MPRMNLPSTDTRNQFSCCLCLHVRTGTIIFGVSQIILQILFISVLLIVTFNPDLGFDGSLDKTYDARLQYISLIFHFVPAVSDLHQTISTSFHNKAIGSGDVKQQSIRRFGDDDDGSDENRNPVQLPSSKVQLSSREMKWNHFGPFIATTVTLFSLAFCCFMVHGAITRQPTHLLPFFMIQVFDLIICLIHLLEFMSSASDLRMMVHTKSGLVYVKSTSLTFIVLSISCLMLAFKAYCLGMVWDCYKYLMLVRRGHSLDTWISDQFDSTPFWSLFRPRRLSNQGNTSMNASGVSRSGHEMEPAPPVYDQSNDLPKYEDALKIPANAYAPPPYFSSKMSTSTGDESKPGESLSPTNDPSV